MKAANVNCCLKWVIRSLKCNVSERQLHVVYTTLQISTVYPKKYAQGFCFAVLCFGYTLTDFPISIRLTSLALWQSSDCPSANKATLMNMDKYFMWIHYERLRNHNKAKHNKTVCIFLRIYCLYAFCYWWQRQDAGTVVMQLILDSTIIQILDFLHINSSNDRHQCHWSSMNIWLILPISYICAYAISIIA